jgi:hypothetical protein
VLISISFRELRLKNTLKSGFTGFVDRCNYKKNNFRYNRVTINFIIVRNHQSAVMAKAPHYDERAFQNDEG